MSNLRDSIRKRTVFAELQKVSPCYSGRGSTKEIREILSSIFKRKVRTIRQARQAEKGLVEFPFGLFNGAERIKTVCMTEKEAHLRNKSIASLGYVWRRCGY